MSFSENDSPLLSDLIELNIDDNFFSATVKWKFIEDRRIIPKSLITIENIKKFLFENEVKIGYIDENISRFADDFFAEELKEIYYRIAEHKSPSKGADANIIWYFGPHAKTDETYNANNYSKIDHRDKTILCIVFEGDIICVKLKPRAGIDGMKINGQPLTADTGSDVELKNGYGIEIEETSDRFIYKSTFAGSLNFSQNLVYVSYDLTLNCDVDFNTGNIHYLNPITINGNVTSGFVVESKENITINGFIESGAKVVTEKNIEIKGGVIGDETLVIAGDSVTAAYAHNSKIEAKNIIIKKFALNAELISSGSIEIYGENLKNEQAAVIGSILSAKNKITVDSVGKNLAAKSIFKICDLNAALKLIDDKISEYRRVMTKIVRSINIDIDINKFTEYLKSSPEENKASLKKIFEQLQLLIANIEKLAADKKKITHNFFEKIESNEILILKKVCYPLKIIIYDKMLNIEENYYNVSFLYDKVNHKIIMKNN